MNLVLPSILLIYFVHQSCCTNNTYTTKYDGIDLDEILASDRLLKGYVNCLLDKGPCTPDGKELKSNLPDAIENDCSKCTERQSEGAEKVMHYIIDNKPADWDKLEQKYNPDGSYKLKYLERKEQKDTNSTKNKMFEKDDSDEDDDDDDDDDDDGQDPRKNIKE